ncbi:hypothetical protein BT96DRAFT_383193, partial [Gymnopus androsaceus JB14]
DGQRLLNNANWARYNLAVRSLQKDTEIASSTLWNQNLPGKPTVNFRKFFDGENITQERPRCVDQRRHSPFGSVFCSVVCAHPYCIYI